MKNSPHDCLFPAAIALVLNMGMPLFLNIAKVLRSTLNYHRSTLNYHLYLRGNILMAPSLMNPVTFSYCFLIFMIIQSILILLIIITVEMGGFYVLRGKLNLESPFSRTNSSKPQSLFRYILVIFAEATILSIELLTMVIIFFNIFYVFFFWVDPLYLPGFGDWIHLGPAVFFNYFDELSYFIMVGFFDLLNYSIYLFPYFFFAQGFIEYLLDTFRVVFFVISECMLLLFAFICWYLFKWYNRRASFAASLVGLTVVVYRIALQIFLIISCLILPLFFPLLY